MTVQLYRAAWGAVGEGPYFAWDNLLDFTRDIAAEGYAGVEFPFTFFDNPAISPVGTEEKFREILAETGLGFVPLIATLPDRWDDYEGHLELFKKLVKRAADWGATKASVHTGADSMDDDMVVRYYTEATSIARDSGIEPYYETHRARPFYNPWRTVKLLERLPDIWLTADFAHWLPVVDRLPYDLQELFEICAARTGHLHARIGHEKGPQVPDPRDPIWDKHTELHEQWWDLCVNGAIARGDSMIIVPEFGPWPYLDHMPFTHEPVADVKQVVAWMRDRLKSRYAS